ncbi:MAG TPA: hypothetical protein VFN26_19775 [Candidatus Acidoferrum sp.]|nr:hypothetical protein [Candidatus Acidoferrum sp.]
MKISQAHLEALVAFGYSEAEARFLYLVATHSGYFVARQFLEFSGAHWGKRTTGFWAKLQSLRHARVERFPKSGVVYHVFSRRLYRQIERENIRNRRTHELDFIKKRLAILDFVLAHPEHQYLETEPEKVRFFCGTLGLERHNLPSRIYLGSAQARPTLRYFVDKFPMYLLDQPSSLPPVVTFTYVHAGVSTLLDFTHHLEAYLPLLRQLSEFGFVYASRTDACFRKAAEVFRSLVKIPLEDQIVDQLLRYFRVRRAWDEKQYGAVTDADLLFRNAVQSRFSGERFEALYRGWKRERISEDGIWREFGSNPRKRTVTFGTCLLKKTAEQEGEEPESG